MYYELTVLAALLLLLLPRVLLLTSICGKIFDKRRQEVSASTQRSEERRLDVLVGTTRLI